MADDAVLLDTNVLATATTPARKLHQEALSVLNDWPSQGIPLCVTGQVLREYLVIATRPAEVNGLDLAVEDALVNVAEFRRRSRLLAETAAVVDRLGRLVRDLGCRGKQIHDANLVAVALVHGTGRFVTENVGDFRRFERHVEIVDLADV